MSDPAVLAPADDDIIGKAYDARLMRRLLGYLRPYWRSVGAASAASSNEALSVK